MMTLERLGVAAAVIGALVLGVMLVPNKDEQITALLRDHRNAAALSLLDELYKQGDRRPTTLFQMYKLHEVKGNTEKMEELLLAYLAVLPDDLKMREKLAELYFLTFNYNKYLEQLERIVALEPTEPNLAKLLSSHRINGRDQAELLLLEKYRHTPAFSVEGAERLGLLYISSSREKEGLVALREMDDRDTGQTKVEGRNLSRLTLFRLLLAENSIEDAYERSMRWAGLVEDDKVYILKAMEQFTQRGLRALSIALAERAVHHDQSMTFVLIDLLLQENRLAPAKARLAHWIRWKSQLRSDEVVSYVNASIAARDLPAAVRFAETRGFARLPDEALLSIAREAFYQGKQPLLRSVIPFINPSLLQARPLLAAQLALALGNIETARNIVHRIDFRELPQTDWSVWRNVAEKALGVREANRRLAAAIDKPGKTISRALLADFAEAASVSGSNEDAQRAWTKLGGRFPLRFTNGGKQVVVSEARNPERRHVDPTK